MTSLSLNYPRRFPTRITLCQFACRPERITRLEKWPQWPDGAGHRTVSQDLRVSYKRSMWKSWIPPSARDGWKKAKRQEKIFDKHALCWLREGRKGFLSGRFGIASDCQDWRRSGNSWLVSFPGASDVPEKIFPEFIPRLVILLIGSTFNWHHNHSQLLFLPVQDHLPDHSRRQSQLQRLREDPIMKFPFPAFQCPLLLMMMTSREVDNNNLKTTMTSTTSTTLKPPSSPSLSSTTGPKV